MCVTEALAAGASQVEVSAAGRDADRAVTDLYREHYGALVRLAALLVSDVAAAQAVVQDSFVAMHAGWRRLSTHDKAESYLRRSVVSRSRSVLRHRRHMVEDGGRPEPAPDSAERDTVTVLTERSAVVLLERSAVVAALAALPAREREALALRYYGDLSEAQIASIMGVSRGAVKSHTARAMSALRSVLEAQA